MHALPAVVLLSAFTQAPAEPTAEAVAAQIRRLTSDPDEKERAAAARWFGGTNAQTKAALDAVPQLEKVARTDGPFDARAWTVMALADIARAHGKPVPQVLYDLLEDDEVGPIVTNHALEKFKPLPSEALPVLLKYAASKKPRCRDDGLFVLARHFPKDPAALKAIRAARTDDPDFWVRHAGHVALFNATQDLGEFFPYVLRFQAEHAALPDLKPDASEAEKAERARWNLTLLGLAVRQAEWIEERPAELRELVAKALADRDPLVRRGAADTVGRFAEALRAKPAAGVPGQELLPFNDDKGPKFNPKKQREGMARVVNGTAVRERLKENAASDPDPKARAAAAAALKALDAGK